MDIEKDEDEEKEDITNLSQQKTTQDKKKIVAKDLVELEHVEVKKQEMSQETKKLSDALKQFGQEESVSEELSNDEITILESFVGKRLFLRRIAIVVNQSRIPLGIEPFNKEQLELLLDRLIHKNYIGFDIVNQERVYFLTDKGKEYIQ
ncbi:MAG: hypothetical protein EU529_08465 [Promethearchaeota archaeon]|nr:MAG: hypothetical protein EU529_08465 [Candidatus Lokiarchaeota archaeon]